MFRTAPLSIIRNFFTVHTAMVYGIQLASRIRTELQFRPDPARKNKFEKLVHLFGFIRRKILAVSGFYAA